MMNRDQNQDQQNVQGSIGNPSGGQMGNSGNMGSGQSTQSGQRAQGQTSNQQTGAQNAMGTDQQVEQALNPNPQNLNPNDPNVAKDPVCGMLVDKSTAPDTIAPAIGTSGPRLYFCSAACKKIFEDNPERFGYTNY